MAATSAATARNTPFEGGGGGGMDSGTRGEEYVAFMVRMANLDVTMCSPVPGLDLEWNSFEGRPIQSVPVVRIFGATPAGQKVGLYLHNAFPYFFINIPQDSGLIASGDSGSGGVGDDNVYDNQSVRLDIYRRRLSAGIERALDVSLGNKGQGGQYVHDIQLVRGRPFYGFHLAEACFFKVYLYNPALITRTATLLRSGAIMQTTFQPYEAHIPFLLQLCVDFNMFGMGYVKLSHPPQFRMPLPPPSKRSRWWRGESVMLFPHDRHHHHSNTFVVNDTPATSSAFSSSSSSFRGTHGKWAQRHWFSDYNDKEEEGNDSTSAAKTSAAVKVSPAERETMCDLEVDADIQHVLNFQERIGTPCSEDDRKRVNSLAYLWEEEKERRREAGEEELNAQSFLELSEADERIVKDLSSYDADLRVRMDRLIQEEAAWRKAHPGPALRLRSSAAVAQAHDAVAIGGAGGAVKQHNSHDVPSSSPAHQLTQPSRINGMPYRPPQDWVVVDNDKDDSERIDHAMSQKRIWQQQQEWLPAANLPWSQSVGGGDGAVDLAQSHSSLSDFGVARYQQQQQHQHYPQQSQAERASQALLDVDAERILSQSSDAEMVDILGWMHDGDGGGSGIDDILLGELVDMDSDGDDDDNDIDNDIGKDGNDESDGRGGRGSSDKGLAIGHHFDGQDENGKTNHLAPSSQHRSAILPSPSPPLLSSPSLSPEPPHRLNRNTKEVTTIAESQQQHEDDDTRPPHLTTFLDLALTNPEDDFHIASDDGAVWLASDNANVNVMRVGEDQGSHYQDPAALSPLLLEQNDRSTLRKRARDAMTPQTVTHFDDDRRHPSDHCHNNPATKTATFTARSSSKRVKFNEVALVYHVSDTSVEVTEMKLTPLLVADQIAVEGSDRCKSTADKYGDSDLDDCTSGGGFGSNVPNHANVNTAADSEYHSPMLSPDSSDCSDRPLCDSFDDVQLPQSPQPQPQPQPQSQPQPQPLQHPPPEYVSVPQPQPHSPTKQHVDDSMDIISTFVALKPEVDPMVDISGGDDNFSVNFGDNDPGNTVVARPSRRPYIVEVKDRREIRRRRVLTFCRPPPDMGRIVNGLHEVGKPVLQYQVPFFGDPTDASVDSTTFAGLHFDIASSDVKALRPFGKEDDGVTRGRHHHRCHPPILHASSPPKINNDIQAASNKNNRRRRILTPSRAPPLPNQHHLHHHERELPLSSLISMSSLESPYLSHPQQKEDEVVVRPVEPPPPTVARDKVSREVKSQIEPPTPADNPHGYLFSQEFQETIVSEVYASQGLTILGVEVHVNARGDLRPNPALDSIQCLYYCIRDDALLSSCGSRYRDQLGMVAVVNNDNEDDNTNMTSATNTSFVRNEEALFQHLARLVRDEVDPDVLVAFELQSASWGYLFERAAVLEYDLMGEITRGRRTQGSFDKERDPYGFAHASGIHVPGRSVLNTWRILRSEVKSTSYTYESMVFHLLHRRVPHYSFSTLTGMYGSSGCGNNNKHSDRWRVHQYYLERVQYTQYMLDSLNIVGRTAELARLYGITFFEVLSRGSQFRVESLVMRLTKPNNYILLSPSKQQVSAQMAPECLPLVMEPQSGFYQDPLLVLDFQSLYPSIIIAYNYCYSTCVGRLQAGEGESNAKKFGATNLELPRGTIEHLRDYIFIAPNEVMFIKPEVQVGVLPRMLVEILETRVMVKAAMKRAHNNNDPALYRLLDARQLGLKLLANVTYGYTSASFSGRMPCIDIADSIVQTARETLERAIRTVNSHPTWHARVVYGDTDSLFVLLPGASRERAFEVGNEIATTITQMNPWPVKLKFEKVYHPSLLLAKKRYVGYKYESKEQVIPDFDAKGIETVRRDSCPAVAKILEKSICLLFERRDISSIRTYVQRQFHKLLVGRVSLQDLVFRKEVRLGTYAAGKSVPPAALVSTKEMERDPRAEPRYGERVPYIVAVGHRAARLIDLVYHPDYFIKYPDRLKPNSHYYITKQIIPALSRVFNLIGVDVQAWYNQMPKNTRMLQFSSVLGGGMSAVGKNAAANTKTRIDHYYMSQHCPVCDGMSQRGLCEKCRQQSPQASSLILTSRVHRLASESQHINQLCTQCCGMLGAAGRSQGDVIRCDSLDCPVLFERHRANSTLAYLTQLLHSAF